MKRYAAVVLVGLLAVGCSSPGVVTNCYTNGEKKEMIVKDGVSIQWNTDKSIRNKCNFKGMKPYTGRWITRWRRNLLHEEREYRDGKLHGDRIIYNWEGKPKWGRGYFMGRLVKKMVYKDGELWSVDEYPEKVEKLKRKAAKRARKIEERQKKRLEKVEKKRQARERKEAEKEKKREEREEAKRIKEREREEAGKKRLEEREKKEGEKESAEGLRGLD